MQRSDSEKQDKRSVTTQRKVIFSFFSGGGFLDLGFEKENFEVAFANEIHLPFLKAYKHAREKMGVSLPKYGCSNTDISSLSDDEELAKM